MLILPKFIEIKNYLINVKKDKKLLYKVIYNLELMKMEILKTYLR